MSNRQGPVIISCCECGKEFYRHVCHIHKNNFCDRKCKGLWMSRNSKGADSPNWHGGKFHRMDGYVFSRMEDGSYKQDHRLAAEEKIGRPLKQNEIVHHVDGNKSNNDPDNLVVMTRADHAALHHTKARKD